MSERKTRGVLYLVQLKQLLSAAPMLQMTSNMITRLAAPPTSAWLSDKMGHAVPARCRRLPRPSSEARFWWSSARGGAGVEFGWLLLGLAFVRFSTVSRLDSTRQKSTVGGG